MKIAHFDCFAGIAGDMILGALVDQGVDLKFLQDELKKLNIDEFELKVERVVKKGVSGTKVHVIFEEGHVHRHLKDIYEILDASDLKVEIIQQAKEVFRKIAVAEAKVHNTTPEKIHFHEVGAMDAIIDVVGTLIGIDQLGVERITASPLHIGTGFVKCAHGMMPVPAPATLEILKGVPTYCQGISKELVTPTGAALITTLAEEFTNHKEMTVESIGYGAGTRDLEQIPNLLRLTVGKKNSI
ncbi:MAG: nickel pincer cofactor biosynthesis protein LarC [Halanaerobiales bacterium]|nr:nickel pincer cofactor biosynthesis protein LarC [Halanaerobiales bacterium]